jgi:predicted nucleic acid-binding protein
MIVSNTGPLAVLGKAQLLFILQELHEEVLVPRAVELELKAKTEGVLMFTTNPWIKVADVRNKELVKGLMLSVDQGEAEAIALALRQNACLLIDDLLGRKAAKRLGLLIHGTLGLLIAAKNKGIITSVQDCIERIVEVGYYLDDKLIETVLRTAKELEGNR